MATEVHTPFVPDSLPIVPTTEEWRAMTQEEREHFLVKANCALSDPRLAMTEGRPHKKAKAGAVDMLDLHFKAMGRVVYVAEEMSVAYPGEAIFSPDVLAVLDVPQPEDDPRMSWVVADEKKGLDFVLEVLHRGDRDKDLVTNVERYARLEIPEYFIYDRAKQRVHGHRLTGPGTKRYERIVPQSGRYRSNVLGLDLAIEGGALRFFQGMAELFGSADLIGRLRGIVEDLEIKADEAQTQADQARAQADQALAGLREAILALLHARGLTCSDEARARVLSCADMETLKRWLVRATTAGSVEDVW